MILEKLLGAFGGVLAWFYSHITERGQPFFAQTTLVTCPYQVRDLQEHLQDIQKQLLDLF